MNKEWLKSLEEIQGSAAAKERLRAVWKFIVGELNEEEACAQLNVSADAFHEMRDAVLQAMLSVAEKLE